LHMPPGTRTAERGDLRKPPTIVFCQLWKSNAIRDSLSLARAYPKMPSTDLQKNCALNSDFCDLNIHAADLSTRFGRVAMHDFIKRLANDVFFPEEVQILVAAFDDAWAKLQSSHAQFAEEAYAAAAREILAKRIIMAAQRGERLSAWRRASTSIRQNYNGKHPMPMHTSTTQALVRPNFALTERKPQPQSRRRRRIEAFYLPGDVFGLEM